MRLTIGELAARGGVRTSTLRYYERQGLLIPDDRSDGGYRLYGPAAEKKLRFIHAAQRLGFTLEDIKELLAGLEGGLSDDRVMQAAEDRFVDLERRLTELLVTRHELEQFLLDLGRNLDRPAGSAHYEQLITHLCGHTPEADLAELTLGWLLERTGCRLANVARDELADALRGVHVHLWQRDDSYQIMVASNAPEVESALRELARVEAECHTHPTPTLQPHDDGWLFVAEGDEAFLFAQFFLAIEQG